MISIEVVAAWPDSTVRVPLEVPVGSTLTQAVAAAVARSKDLADKLSVLEAQSGGSSLAWGIFGREAAGESVLEAGARVELYRPLQRDPREARRLLASQGLNVTHGE
ncbi:MAG: RnfH family protein [Gammaproteobacteria bacterium]